MGRLIDADALKTELVHDYAYAAAIMVDKQPTIDPVRHGRWMIGKDGAPKCTGCGYRFELFGLPAISTYCPACGAKMDGAT